MRRHWTRSVVPPPLDRRRPPASPGARDSIARTPRRTAYGRRPLPRKPPLYPPPPAPLGAPPPPPPLPPWRDPLSGGRGGGCGVGARTLASTTGGTSSSEVDPARSASGGGPVRGDGSDVPPPPPRAVDAPASPPPPGGSADRLPNWLIPWGEEFPRTRRSDGSDSRRRRWRSGRRIALLAASSALESGSTKLLLLSASTVLGIGAVEASLLCSEWPLIGGGWDGPASFAARYALAQLAPSCVWETADANVVAYAAGMDPSDLLRDLDPSSRPDDAAAVLRLQALAAGRSVAALFMLLAQLVRAVSAGAGAARSYGERIRSGAEPPLGGLGGGRVYRLGGRGSGSAEVALRRYGPERVFPTFEDPGKVAHLVRAHSMGGRVPVFWCVRPPFYGHSFSWSGLSVDGDAFLRSSTGRNILCLEADATNESDPLALGTDRSLDLTLDDASQAFRSLESLHRSAEGVPPFRSLKVLLANSLEEARTGGGHLYTLRHRVRYAREADVLIDSRAPVLSELLRWCGRVGGRERRILVQTSSRRYFLGLQLLLRRYGYEVYDPLDWRKLDSIQDRPTAEGAASNGEEGDREEGVASKVLNSLLSVLLEEKDGADGDGNGNGNGTAKGGDGEERRGKHKRRLSSLARLSKMPRLVYYEKDAETINAVRALVDAGEVDVASCCVLLDKEDGVALLEESAMRRGPSLVERRMREKRRRDLEAELAGIRFREVCLSERDERLPAKAARRKLHLQRQIAQLDGGESASDAGVSSGLHIVCSSVIYDDLFRQVRQWARMGYSSQDIQKELDARYGEIIRRVGDVSQEFGKDGDARAREHGPSEDVPASVAEDSGGSKEDHGPVVGTEVPPFGSEGNADSDNAPKV